MIKLVFDNFSNVFFPMKTLGVKHDFFLRVRRRLSVEIFNRGFQKLKRGVCGVSIIK